MDLTQIPVKESCTRRIINHHQLASLVLSVYIRGLKKLCKSFMTKRLNKKRQAGAPREPSRGARIERPRPNRYQTFLKRLRAGGRSNMYGAIPYLMQAFTLDRAEAFRIVCEWVDEQNAEAVP
jgi:hypothetical protein